MHRLFVALTPAFRIVLRWPSVVLAVALGATVLAGLAATRLRVDADLIHLLPGEYPSVAALEKLRATVGAESTADVAIESPSFRANVAFANAFIPRALALRQQNGDPFFTRADFRRDVGFLERNALYFATYDELDALTGFLREQERLARTSLNPLDFGTLGPDYFVDRAAGDVPRSADSLRTLLAALDLREYPVSEDSTVLAIRFAPSGSQTDVAFIDSLYAALDSLLGAMQPQQFHPRMRVTTSGRLLRQSVEVHAITDDVAGSFGAGVGTVLLAVVLYFLYKSIQARSRGRRIRWRVVLQELARAPVTALVLGLPLAMALVWTFGVAALTIGTLNLMTSTLGLVLFGLGIEYGIHFYARYTEERGTGKPVRIAAETTFVSTGEAIMASALTMASALFVLTLADFRGFRDFGLIGGIGVLFSLVAMLTVLPAIISLAERLRLLNLSVVPPPAKVVARRLETKRFPAALPIVIGSVVLVVGSVWAIRMVEFEWDFGALEPRYEAYEARARTIERVYPPSARRNPAYFVLDRPEDVRTVIDALKMEAGTDPLLLAVESLQERFPTDTAGARIKLARLDSLRALLDSPFLSADPSGQIAQLRRAASTRTMVPLDSVPDFLTRAFRSKSGEVGQFVLAYPSESLSDGRVSLRFAGLVGEVQADDGRVFHAGSTSLVAADMLWLMQEESPLMVALTFAFIAALIAAIFRSVKWTLLALLPLGIGMAWMLGGMVATGLTLTFYNLVALPAVLGIGNDCGVHIAHRYREEGPGSLRRVLRSTGEHVAMSSVTSLLGFAGLLFSFHPGLRSIGQLAVLGIATTLLASLVFLPALLQVLEDRHLLFPRPKTEGDTSLRARTTSRIMALARRPSTRPTTS